MTWNTILDFINPELIIVVVACWVIGYILKQTPRVPDWTIIYFVTLIATLCSMLLLGVSVQSLLQGVLCGAVAVYGNQIIKQTKEGTKRDDQKGMD